MSREEVGYHCTLLKLCTTLRPALKFLSRQLARKKVECNYSLYGRMSREEVGYHCTHYKESDSQNI